MGDTNQQEIRERIWVEKFDHSTDPPTLVETVFRENTRRVATLTSTDDAPDTPERS